MAKNKKTLGSTRRFGSRYGRTLRAKIAKSENQLKKKHICPFCSYKKVKRRFVGVWECKKCEAVFTGKAYSPAEKRRMVGATEESVAEIEA